MIKNKPEPPKKEMTPDEIIISSTSKKLQLENELKRQSPYALVGNLYKSNPKIDDIKAQIKVEETKIELARQNKDAEFKKPQPHTLIQKTTQTTNTQLKSEFKINSDNQKTNNWGAQGNKFEFNKNEKTKATKSSPEIKKKSKVKLIFFIVVAVLVIAGTAALSSYITSCVYKNKNSSSCTYSINF